MCLGSKTEQRKWWLYNRFKYIDSKYNAGSAAADSVSMRTWYSPAAGETYGITVTPYADIYATIMYGVSPSVNRAPRNTAVQLACNLDHLEFTDTYIYSASQIKSFGDLSPFKPDAVEFSKATHVQELKFGDASPSYTNPNLKSLTLGNNTLLKKLDCRNCTNLGTGSQKSINIENCSNIEEVYFDGTQIQGLTLPNGGFLKKLHLPDTMANLTLLNQKNLTEFVCPGFTNVTTCRLENNSSAVDTEAILRALPASARLRLIGFEWETEDIDEVYDILDILDTMRGIDEQGNTISIADGGCRTSVNGTIRTGAVTGDELAAIQERYPYLNVAYTSITSTLTYMNYDGTETLHTETITGGGNGTWNGTSDRPYDEDYSYTFAGWSRKKGGGLPQANARDNVTASRTVYAAFITEPIVTVVYKNEAGTNTLHIENVTSTHEGGWTGHPEKPSTPEYSYTFAGWSLTVGGSASPNAVKNVTEKRIVYAVFTATRRSYEITFANSDNTTLQTSSVEYGSTPIYAGSTPIDPESRDPKWTFDGWTPEIVAVTGAATYTAVYNSGVQIVDRSADVQAFFDAIENGTVQQQFDIGNYFTIDMGSTYGTSLHPQIVGFGKKSMQNGTVSTVDIIFKDLLLTKHGIKAQIPFTGGWGESDMRSWLAETGSGSVWMAIPEVWRQHIIPVVNYSFVYDGQANSETIDKLCIPS